MPYIKYQHIERFGTDEVSGIECGTCYVFPKIDGANVTVWFDNGEVCFGSRNRPLSFDTSFQGLEKYMLENKDKFTKFFSKHPTVHLYGEWLVPHTLKTYRPDAWRKLYIFDVLKEDGTYMVPEEYIPKITEEELDSIPCMKIIVNGSEEMFRHESLNNTFLVEDGKGLGEGIVIKNYDFINRYGRRTWAKIVLNDFKDKHLSASRTSIITGTSIESSIVDRYVTSVLVEKIYVRIVNEAVDWNSKHIERLFGETFHDLIVEEMWDIVKKFKKPTIDFGLLYKYTITKIKELKPELF